MRIVFCLFGDDTGIRAARHLRRIHRKPDERGRRRPGAVVSKLRGSGHAGGGAQRHARRRPRRSPMRGAVRRDASSRLRRSHARVATRTGRTSPPPSSAPCSSRSWTPRNAAPSAHYTTEKNILKVIEPLFMDELWAEFARLKSRDSRRLFDLRRFQEKLGQLQFFDPACRLRQLPHHRLPGAADAGDRADPRDSLRGRDGAAGRSTLHCSRTWTWISSTASRSVSSPPASPRPRCG